jgi:DNA-binding GntR family transcriptional regulator
VRSQVRDYPRTLSEVIYNYLKDAITSATIKSNQRIQEKELASYFNVSTTPVREAIKRLAGEGLIITSSHKEAVVAELSYKELMDIYEAIVCIDGMSARLAFSRALDVVTKEVQAYLVKLRKFARGDTVEEWLDVNEKLYLRICELSGNQFLYQIRQMINDQLGRYKPLRFFLFRKSNLIDYTMQKFELLLKALKSRNPKKIQNVDLGRWLRFVPAEDDWIRFQQQKEPATGERVGFSSREGFKLGGATSLDKGRRLGTSGGVKSSAHLDRDTILKEEE